MLVSRRDYRMYAITMGNMIVTGFFAFITAAQFAVGIYLIILAANSPGMVSMWAIVLRSVVIDVYGLWLF